MTKGDPVSTTARKGRPPGIARGGGGAGRAPVPGPAGPGMGGRAGAGAGAGDGEAAAAAAAVVVGAGFAGLRALRALGPGGGPGARRVLVVDAKGFFEYTPAAPRALVCPATAEASLRPLPAGAVWGRVVGLEAAPGAHGAPRRSRLTVVLEDGRRIPCQVVIWASGSQYPCRALKPGLSPGPESRASLPEGCPLAARRAELQAAREVLRGARRVAVLGGGQAGVELAAEVAGEFRGEKRVLLAGGAARLLPGMPPRAGVFAQKWLEARGVQVWLGSRARVRPGSQELSSSGSHFVEGPEGSLFEADVVYDCTGNLFPPGALPPQLRSGHEPGKVRVDAALRVEGWDGLLSCGDICEPRALQTAFRAEIAGEAAGRNARRMLAGEEPRDLPLSPSPTVVTVSLHRCCGILQFNGLVLCGFLATVVKAAVEACVLSSVAGNPLGIWAMAFMEHAAFFLGRVVPPPSRESQEEVLQLKRKKKSVYLR